MTNKTLAIRLKSLALDAMQVLAFEGDNESSRALQVCRQIVKLWETVEWEKEYLI